MSAIVVQGLTNSMGTAVIAANVAIMRVDGFAMMPNFTFGTTSTTYVGHNIGAGHIDRVRQGIRDMLKLALSTSGVLVACIPLFGRQLIQLFTDTEDVITIGVYGLRLLLEIEPIDTIDCRDLFNGKDERERLEMYQLRDIESTGWPSHYGLQYPTLRQMIVRTMNKEKDQK